MTLPAVYLTSDAMFLPAVGAIGSKRRMHSETSETVGDNCGKTSSNFLFEDGARRFLQLFSAFCPLTELCVQYDFTEPSILPHYLFAIFNLINLNSI